jgi:pilus assembly protein CpaB
LLLIAAFLVAAVGSAFIFLYVRGIDERALDGQQPVRVLVVKTAIAAGTPASEAERTASFELRTVARSSVAAGALSEITPVRNLVTLTQLFPGEQVLAAKFGAAGTGTALPMPANTIAVSVQLADPARVAGFVQPGSEVAVFVTLRAAAATGRQSGRPSGETSDGPAATGGQTTRTLLPRANVIAAGPATLVSNTSTDAQTGQSNTEQIPKAILTLALNQADAERLVYAQANGELYFGLLSKTSKTDKSAGITERNLFN